LAGGHLIWGSITLYGLAIFLIFLLLHLFLVFFFLILAFILDAVILLLFFLLLLPSSIHCYELITNYEINFALSKL